MKFFALAALLGLTSATQLEAAPIPAHVEGWPGYNWYSRKVPDRFSQDTDDIFIRSMIRTYALERQTCDGKGCHPDGYFFLNEQLAKQAAKEVLATHKGLKGAALKSYLSKYWKKAWGHFDVNRTGAVEVLRIPSLMRFLASDQYLSLGESG